MVVHKSEHHDGKEAECRFPKGIYLSPWRRAGTLQHLPAKSSVDHLYGSSVITGPNPSSASPYDSEHTNHHIYCMMNRFKGTSSIASTLLLLMLCVGAKGKLKLLDDAICDLVRLIDRKNGLSRRTSTETWDEVVEMDKRLLEILGLLTQVFKPGTHEAEDDTLQATFQKNAKIAKQRAESVSERWNREANCWQRCRKS